MSAHTPPPVQSNIWTPDRVPNVPASDYMGAERYADELTAARGIDATRAREAAARIHDADSRARAAAWNRPHALSY